MSKPRKKYNPNKHRIDPNAAFTALRLSRPVQEESKVILSIGINTALGMFTKGIAQKCHFDTLAATVDLNMMLSQNIFQNAYSDEITKARNAMIRCKDRFHKTGKLGLDGEGYNAVKEAIAIHDQFVSEVTGAKILRFMKKRADHIVSGNFYKGVEVAA